MAFKTWVRGQFTCLKIAIITSENKMVLLCVKICGLHYIVNFRLQLIKLLIQKFSVLKY